MNTLDKIKDLEKGIEMRKREIKSHEETIEHFKKRNIFAAIGYIPDGDWRKIIYWLAAAVLTFTVTY